MENVPVDAKRDLVFSSSDHYALLKLREAARETDRKMEAMTESINSLTAVINSMRIDGDGGPSKSRDVSEIMCPGVLQGLREESVSQTPGGESQSTPSKMTVRDKVSKFNKFQSNTS